MKKIFAAIALAVIVGTACAWSASPETKASSIALDNVTTTQAKVFVPRGARQNRAWFVEAVN